MTRSLPGQKVLTLLMWLWMAIAVSSGCSRTQYRLRADNDVYQTISERNGDPRWQTVDTSIEIDPRSRYFDQYDPDRPPMPQDDPASHGYMHCVNGMPGWKHWHDNGHRLELENPSWEQSLPEYVDVNDVGEVRLNIDTAMRLAYVHSPQNQSQLETLYLSALDVTAERFRLDAQFFGGYDILYRHDGQLVPAGLGFDSTTGQYVITPPFDGVDSNRVTLGRTSAANPALQVSRRFASAGQLIAGFANSFVFEFSGNDVSLASSLANFTFIQPLLRGAGRDIALEDLTRAERALLGNLRAYSQFRQGFYTQVAIGEIGVSLPQRFGQSTSIQVFNGTGFLGGYAGLLQQLQEVRNSADNLKLQERTLEQLEALLAVGVIDLVQVDQFRQSVESERARLLQAQNDFEFSLDNYKTNTLGLPPDLPIELDDDLIEQFQLIPPEAAEVQDSIAELQNRVGALPDDYGTDDLEPILSDAESLVEKLGQQLEGIEQDVGSMKDAVNTREESMAEDDIENFSAEREQLDKTLQTLKFKFDEAKQELETIRGSLASDAAKESARKLVVWLGSLLRYAQQSVLVQARARLETVTVEDIDLESEDAFRIALTNRLDFMNGRAALVDSWRQIQVSADALQSILDFSASGDLQTARNNPVSFRAPTGSFSAGVEFDAPLTRLLERNAYRESLISYQRNRRNFIQSRDRLHLDLRQLLRQIRQLRTNLEIQRRAVAIAIRRVDLTRANLYAPVPPPRPGQRVAQFGPTSAFNLLSSLGSLRDTQNSFLRAWLNYYAARMRLARELGLMQLDTEGRWIEMPPPSSSQDQTDALWEPIELGPEMWPQGEELPTGPGGSGAQENGKPIETNNAIDAGDTPPPIPTPNAGNATIGKDFEITLFQLIPFDEASPASVAN